MLGKSARTATTWRSTPMRHFLLICVCCFATNTGFADERDLLSGHPRPSYSNVKDINAMAAALRKSLASSEHYSFSRSWWQWDRLRCRYVDEGQPAREVARSIKTNVDKEGNCTVSIGSSMDSSIITITSAGTWEVRR
tara:strand:+ start:1304 stop:1717 length:414 start_codon:yes stop_codon:yes gene_type:complete